MVDLSKVFPHIEKDHDRWVQVLYSEIWKQLAHQDQVANSRANIFHAVQTALFGILLVGSPNIWQFSCAKFSAFELDLQLHLGSLLFGITWVFVGILLLLQGYYFRRVTEAGEQYVRLRHAHLRALEQLTIGDFGPALTELRWRQYSKESRQRYQPFTSLQSEDEKIQAAIVAIEVDAFNHFGGYPYLYRLLKMWQIIYSVVFVVGSVFFFLGWIPSMLLSLPFEMPIKGFKC